MKSQIYLIESDRNVRPLCLHSTVLLSSNHDLHQSVTIEQLLLKPFEQPKVTTIGHLLSIHLGETMILEHRSDSSWKCDRLDYQDFCLTPHNTSMELTNHKLKQKEDYHPINSKERSLLWKVISIATSSYQKFPEKLA